MNEQRDAILSVRNLTTQFYTRRGIIRVLGGVTFDVIKGKTLGIVGESGSGKSVLALSILNLIDEPGKIEEGEVIYKGKDLLKMSQRELGSIRGGEIAMIFPDPMSAFDPTLPVGVQVIETIQRHHKGVGKKEAKERVIELFRKVKIPSPERQFDEFPARFSGGMIQRVMIADALSSNSDFIIADNPTQALDVTIQAQILELMNELQRTLETTIVFITNSLPILARYADNILVLYAGTIVEHGTKTDVITNPTHPYTRGLIGSIPNLRGERLTRLKTIHGDLPDLSKVQLDRCIFSDRCIEVTEKCLMVRPILAPVRELDTHFSACLLASGTMLGV